MPNGRRARFELFLSENEIHGVRRVFAGETSIYRRWLWIILSLICLSVLVWMFTERIGYFSLYPHTTTSSIRTDTMRLPAVTVFGRNPVRWSAVTGRDLLHIGLYYFGLHPNGSFTTESDVLMPQDVKTHLLRSLRNVTEDDVSELFDYKEFMFRSGHQAKDFLRQCSWSEFGEKPQVDVCHDAGNDVQIGQIINFGNIFTLNTRRNLTLRASTFFSGIGIKINTQTGQYLPIFPWQNWRDMLVKYKTTGVRSDNRMAQPMALMVIHSQLEPASSKMTSTWITLQLETCYTYRVNIKKVTDIYHLGKPYGDCETGSTFTWQIYPPHTQYSHTACVRDCVAYRMYKRFGCTLGEVQTNSSISMCNWSAMSDVDRREMAELRINVSHCGAQCPPPCVETIIEAFVYKEKVVSVSNCENNTIWAQITNDYGLMHEVIYDEALFKLDAFLSDIGGIIGLTFGMSILTLLHVVIYVAQEIVHFIFNIDHLKRGKQ